MISTRKQNPTGRREVLRVMDAPQVVRGNREPVARIARSLNVQQSQAMHNTKTPQYDLKFSACNINTTFTVPTCQAITSNESVYLKKPRAAGRGLPNTL